MGGGGGFKRWIQTPAPHKNAKNLCKNIACPDPECAQKGLGLPLLQYPSPLCRLKWAVTQVIGLHVELTILGEYNVASTTIVGILISYIVFTVDTRAH